MLGDNGKVKIRKGRCDIIGKGKRENKERTTEENKDRKGETQIGEQRES